MFEISKVSDEESVSGLNAMYPLADLKFRKNQLEDAEDLALRAMDGRKRALGRSHILVCQSIDLLSQIYKAKGDLVEFEGYRDLLPRNFECIFSASDLSDPRLCEFIEKLCHMAPENAEYIRKAIEDGSLEPLELSMCKYVALA